MREPAKARTAFNIGPNVSLGACGAVWCGAVWCGVLHRENLEPWAKFGRANPTADLGLARVLAAIWTRNTMIVFGVIAAESVPLFH